MSAVPTIVLCVWLAGLTCAVANNLNRAAFAASEMCGTIASSLGFLFADSASLDAKLDVAAVLCVLGFAGYFAEAAGRQGPGTDLSPGRAVIPGGFASPKGAGGGGVSAALRQRAFYAMLAQGEHDRLPTTVLAGLRFFHTHGAVLAVLFFCGVGNLVAELYYLRSCSRIFVLTTPDHEPPYCDNSAARNWPYWPKTRTMVYELLPTAWTIGFCSTVFMFGGIQRAIAGRRWHYMCSGATCPPWVEAVDHLELEHGWVSWWPTGTRSQLVRNYFVVRALCASPSLSALCCPISALTAAPCDRWPGRWRLSSPWCGASLRSPCSGASKSSTAAGTAAGLRPPSSRSKLRGPWPWGRAPSLSDSSRRRRAGASPRRSGGWGGASTADPSARRTRRRE